MAKDMFPDTEPLLVRDEPWMCVKLGPQSDDKLFNVLMRGLDEIEAILSEPTSPSVVPCTQCACHEADAERLAKENRLLKEALLEAMPTHSLLGTRYPRGVHGS